MATWNSRQPLRITQTRESKEKVNGRTETVRTFDGFHEITMGQPVPDALLTVAFIGDALDQLANLSAADKAKYEQWKAENPRLKDRWHHLETSPRWASIFPEESSILTADTQRITVTE